MDEFEGTLAPPRLDEVRAGGRVRLLTRLSVADARAYDRAVASIARRIERSLSPAAMANRVRGCVAGSATVELEPWRTARRRFARVAGAWTARLPSTGIGDVRNCYASVRDDVLDRRLRHLDATASEIRALRRLLERFHEHGVAGLPIGPHPSAILANAVLAPVDEALADAGLRHLRWVDDVIVFAPTERRASDALGIFGDALAELRLDAATEKTRLVDRLEVATLLRAERFSRIGARL